MKISKSDASYYQSMVDNSLNHSIKQYELLKNDKECAAFYMERINYFNSLIVKYSLIRP